MSQRNLHVLIVEDDLVDRLGCRRALVHEADAAFAFHEADTAAEGLRLARELSPELILLDYHLPDLDGLDFLQALAEGRDEPDIPVIMLTGADEARIAVEAMKRGARDFLVKDTERQYLELLPAVVERVLREEQVRAEKREAEARLHLVADGVQGLLAYVDRELRYRFNNARYTEYLGLAPEALYGRPICEVLGEQACQTGMPHFEAVLAGVPQSFDNVLRHPDGGQRHFYVRLLPHLGSGEVLGFYVIAMDITEHKRAKRELAERRRQLAHLQRLHTAGEMASAIAHEVNQPLQAVVAYCEAAQRLAAAGSPEKLAHALDQAVLQAQRAAEVIRHMRAFLRKGESEPSPHDLNGLVRCAIRLFEADGGLNGFHIETQLAMGELKVLVDPVHIEQVLLNLLRNSSEAMRGAGMQAGRIDVRTCVNAEGMAQLSLRDSGPGLDPGMRSRLFEPFHTTKPDGLGMGLAISHSLIEAHGGRLWSDADTSSGASFHFTLPVSP